MPKIIIIAGTRPEVIKVAPVLLELQKHRSHIETIFCCTGQHRELLNGLFDLFGLTADYNLDLMAADQTLSEITSRMFSGLEKMIQKESPDWILAQGDTATVMTASVLSYYHRIKFGHIEAGLRTGDLYSPYPEEGNRMIADAVAHRLWAPTEKCRNALVNAGIDQKKIRVTGNTVVDALKIVAGFDYDYKNSPIGHYNGEKIVLVTAHRRESFGPGLENICLALKTLSRKFEDTNFVYPVHLNPNVRAAVNKTIQGVRNIHLLEPLNYQDFIHLMKKSFLILTDSGGIQEEAPFFNIPVLVMRNKTERSEGVDAGVSMLVGTDKEQIIDDASRLIGDRDLYRAMATSPSPYGDGKASKYIVKEILEDG
ncbi:MAG: non-hydrolyzing UDP-N-acetylglucosamine 2-epimerase [Planctomycetota bacterium]|jgi:UDP-N-acetylglucosamine 2-epimerase (non-hydrolysing)